MEDGKDVAASWHSSQRRSLGRWMESGPRAKGHANEKIRDDGQAEIIQRLLPPTSRRDSQSPECTKRFGASEREGGVGEGGSGSVTVMRYVSNSSIGITNDDGNSAADAAPVAVAVGGRGVNPRHSEIE
ncbi:hypothetical protein LSH36_531g01002 [Paralvinella palmiformis]|uniref:Uncharacterized protein n=1 Tax=Paralvinella palmiformis TaxID=53620 RepID=A0AAD9J843_9ANNE|nr:hypothetical protein LSH36_531g01002 [Paralvinella palmiformis]